MKKRYLVYYWSKSDAESIEKDYGQSLEDFIDRDQFSVIIDYGENIGSFDDEDEALFFTKKYIDGHSYYDIISIWDSEERHWFN